MDDQDALRLASTEFEARVRGVDPDSLGLTTPCDDWMVRDLIRHVIVGNWMAVRLLAGASTKEAFAPVGGGDDDHPIDMVLESSEAQLAAFAEPGALARTCHHPIGDVSGAQLLGFRIGDLTLHAWDLARALGAGEELNAVLVQIVWDGLAPVAPMIGKLGVFGSGPSGEVAEDAPLQIRLLDLTGRRP